MSTPKDDKQNDTTESSGGTVAGRAATVVDKTPTRKRPRGRAARTTELHEPRTPR